MSEKTDNKSQPFFDKFCESLNIKRYRETMLEQQLSEANDRIKELEKKICNQRNEISLILEREEGKTRYAGHLFLANKSRKETIERLCDWLEEVFPSIQSNYQWVDYRGITHKEAEQLRALVKEVKGD